MVLRMQLTKTAPNNVPWTAMQKQDAGQGLIVVRNSQRRVGKCTGKRKMSVRVSMKPSTRVGRLTLVQLGNLEGRELSYLNPVSRKLGHLLIKSHSIPTREPPLWATMIVQVHFVLCKGKHMPVARKIHLYRRLRCLL